MMAHWNSQLTAIQSWPATFLSSAQVRPTQWAVETGASLTRVCCHTIVLEESLVSVRLRPTRVHQTETVHSTLSWTRTSLHRLSWSDFCHFKLLIPSLERQMEFVYHHLLQLTVFYYYYYYWKLFEGTKHSWHKDIESWFPPISCSKNMYNLLYCLNIYVRVDMYGLQYYVNAEFVRESFYNHHYGKTFW